MRPTIDHFLTALHGLGVEAGLAVLNSGTGCRFTAVFELVGTDLVNRSFFDRLHEPRPQYIESVPFAESFCQIALAKGEFRSTNTARDARVDYSPYQGIVMSYHAVPLLDRALALRGTLCHFDLVETTLDDEQFAMLRQASRTLPAFIYADTRRNLASRERDV